MVPLQITAPNNKGYRGVQVSSLERIKSEGWRKYKHIQGIFKVVIS